MANVAILNLPVAVDLDGTEYLPVVQGDTTKRAQVALITGFADTFPSVPQTITTSQTITPDEAEPYYYLNGSTQLVIPIAAASLAPSVCTVSIENALSAPRATISPDGLSTFFLWPGQKCTLTRVGTIWTADYSPIWVTTESSIIVYVNYATGSDDNDGLADTRPKATLQQAIGMVDKYFDVFQRGVTIKVAAGTFQSGSSVVTKRLRGYHVFVIEGDAATPSNCVMQVPSGGVGITCRDWSGVILRGFKIEAYHQSASISIASPGVVTATAHGLAVDSAVVFQGSLPNELTAGTVYYVKTKLSDDAFTLTTIPGGSVINTTGSSSGVTLWNAGNTGLSASQTGVCDVESCEFGNMYGGIHISSVNGGSVGYVVGTTCTISGDATYHWYASTESTILCSGATINFSGSRTFTAFGRFQGASATTAGITFGGTTPTGYAYIKDITTTLVEGTALPGTLAGFNTTETYQGIGLPILNLPQTGLFIRDAGNTYGATISNGGTLTGNRSWSFIWPDNNTSFTLQASTTIVSGLTAFLGSPTSANLASAVSDETGTGALVFANTPTLVTPNIGAATGTSASVTAGLTARNATATPAAASAVPALSMGSAALGLYWGTGSPNTALTAAKGSLYIRTDGSSSSTRMYVNTDGSTAWTNVTTAA